MASTAPATDWMRAAAREKPCVLVGELGGWQFSFPGERNRKRSRFLQTNDRSVWACRLGGACGRDIETSVGGMA